MEHDCPETPDPTIIAPSACALVFGSYELLQQILMCLPLRDLLLAQKINKTCNGLIRRLENISKVLFLVPAAAPVSASPEGPTQRLIWRDADGGRSKHSPVFNTFITALSIIDHGPNIPWFVREFADEDAVIISQKDVSSQRLSRYLYVKCRTSHHQNGSRLGMLVSHPPVDMMTMQTRAITDRVTMSSDAINWAGITFDDWLACSSLMRVHKGERIRGKYAFPEAEHWGQVAGTIDTITGFDMLRRMNLDFNSVANEKLVLQNKRNVFGTE